MLHGHSRENVPQFPQLLSKDQRNTSHMYLVREATKVRRMCSFCFIQPTPWSGNLVFFRFYKLNRVIHCDYSKNLGFNLLPCFALCKTCRIKQWQIKSFNFNWINPNMTKRSKKDMIKRKLMLLKFFHRIPCEFLINPASTIHWWIWWCPWKTNRPAAHFLAAIVIKFVESKEWSWQFCTYRRRFGLKDFWWGYAKATPGFVVTAGKWLGC